MDSLVEGMRGEPKQLVVEEGLVLEVAVPAEHSQHNRAHDCFQDVLDPEELHLQGQVEASHHWEGHGLRY